MEQDSINTPQPQNEKRPLVSVVRQYETNLATGKTETRMFVKMYFAARDSGLLADIGDRRWRTLCCLATYMDENGRCWPSQGTIARDLGISRQRANERIRDLASYRFEGEPIIRIEKRRIPTKHGLRFASNSYELLSISGLGIFNHEPVSQNPDTRPALKPVSPNPDTRTLPVSDSPDTGSADTNKNSFLNENTFNVERDFKPCSNELGEDDGSLSPADEPPIAHREHGMARRTLEQRHPPTTWIDEGLKPIRDSVLGVVATIQPQVLSDGEIRDLVSRIEDATGDRHSRRRFQAIAQRVPKHVIERVLATIKSAGSDLRNPGAFFEKSIQTECRALEIELPGARPSVQGAPSKASPNRSDPEQPLQVPR